MKSGDVQQQPCMSCGGRGFSTCTACGGVGHALISKSRLRYDRTMEFYQDRVPCTGCFGSGRITCVFCKGSGWVLQSTEDTSSTTENAGVAGVESSETFEFTAYQFARHPSRPEIWASWQHNPGNCLDIGLTLSSSIRIELAQCQTDTWLDIQDDTGNPVPLSIYIGSNGQLCGRWR